MYKKIIRENPMAALEVIATIRAIAIKEYGYVNFGYKVYQEYGQDILILQAHNSTVLIILELALDGRRTPEIAARDIQIF